MTVGIDACLKDFGNSIFDFQLNSAGDILTADFFDTAILVSLLTDRRANESEVLDPENRRGWIGNESTPDFEQGSKIWIYEQSKLTRIILNKISIAGNDALQWFVVDGFADSIDVVETIATISGLALNLIIRRPNSRVEKRHYELWNNTAIPCVDRPVYFSVKANENINLFQQIGFPDYAVDVLWSYNGVQTSKGLDTGGPWHPDTTITLVNNGLIAGAGGNGGFGEYRSGIGFAGGGGGGVPFGLGGNSFKGLADGNPATLTIRGLGSTDGNITGVTGISVTPGVAGDKGGTAITLGHPISLINNDTISGGGGGGGGGGHTGASGANGGNGGFLFVAGGSGSGVDPGVGGAVGDAINTNGHILTIIVNGVINGVTT